MSATKQKIQFNEDQISEFQEAFLLYDNRGDGKIPISLIGDVMRALGQNPTESEVKKLVHEHRADDRVTFEVFLPMLQAICSRRSSDTTEDFVEGTFICIYYLLSHTYRVSRQNPTTFASIVIKLFL
jgi:Ca2+-binding EF-hand superfamily protein